MKTKPFLLIFFGVAAAGWLILLLTLGPTGYRQEFHDTPFAYGGAEYPRKQAHDHYLAIVKSTHYKHYVQRPALNPPLPGRDPDLAAMGIAHLTEGELAFVEAYQADPLYQSEQTRQFWFNWLVNVFNFVLVIVLVWKFGREPFAKFLNEKVTAVRTIIDEAEAGRKQAEQRLARAKEAIDNLPAERERVKEETDARVERELAELQEANEQSVAIFQKETEDRKHKEELNAAMRVKRELVDESIKRVMNKVRKESSDADHAGWLDDFAQGLERRSS